jgi:flagellar basal body-associated protein FliL
MIILIKLAIALFLIAWSGVGLWMLVKYDALFGLHKDDPAESSGARALNVTQVVSVWFGFFAVAFYFLIR